VVGQKIKEILRDKDARRWYDNVARGSRITAEVNLRRLSLFCRKHDLTPKSLVALGYRNHRKLEDLIQDHVTEMERQGKSPGYITGILKGVRSWLAHNEVELKRKVKVKDSSATPTIADERVPEREELRRILMYGDERAKACSALIAQAGLRLQTLGNDMATDGLTIGDLPELKIHGGHVEFAKVPTMVVVRPSLSKARHRYFTFLPAEGCEYLAAYLNKRLAGGENLGHDTPVISVNPGWRRKGPKKRAENGKMFVCTRSISNIIRQSMRPQFNWRPYVLRAYFDTQMLLAESHGKVTHPYRMFFMGHKGDIEARYSTNKGKHPEEVIEDMRRAFKESSEYLETSPKAEKGPSEIDITLKTLETMFRARPRANLEEFYKAKSIMEAAARTEKLGRPASAERRGEASLIELSKEEKVKLLLAELQKPLTVNSGNNHECQFCGAPVESDDMFCSKCMKQIRAKCPSCERLTRIGQPICIKCGAKLK